MKAIRTAPDDDRMLLERPLSEAMRLYALQVAGIFAIALGFVGVFVVALLIERVIAFPQRALRASHAPSTIAPRDIGFPVIVAFVLGWACASGVVWFLLRRRRTLARTAEQGLEVAISELDMAIDAYNAGRFEDAKRLAFASRDAFHGSHVDSGLAEVDLILGWVYLRTGDLNLAHAHAAGSLRYYEGVGDETGIARALSLLGDIALEEGEFAQAEDYYGGAVLRMEWSKDYWEIVSTMLNRATTLDALGRDADARQLRARARELIEQPVARDTSRMRPPLVARRMSPPSATRLANSLRP